MPRTILKPKLLTVLQEGYTLPVFIKDLQAGLVVGVVALPLAIAFAIASGVKPEQGLYTAIIAGFLISLLSGSRVQIGGPTGAFVVIVYGIVQKFGMEGLAISTIMAGIMLLGFGFAGFGAAIKFIPFPVTVGFTSGIALLIFSGQLRDFFGLQMVSLPSEFIGKVLEYGKAAGTVNPYAVAIGCVSVFILLYWPKITQKVPASLIVLVLMTALVKLFHLPVETIGSRFGSVPNHLPHPALPFSHLHWKTIQDLVPSAMTIALLGGIESLLSAVVADGMTGRRHRSNMELVAQGVANLVTPFFGGIPATGAIARTATNIRNGGKTPVAGLIHAVTLALCLVVLGKLVTLIPLAALAAILIIVSYNMSEWRMFVKLFKGPRSDVMALLATFSLTVLMDLTIAIGVGVVLASILFMARMANTSNVVLLGKTLLEDEEKGDEEDRGNGASKDMPPRREDIVRYRITGVFFFGMADKFKDTFSQIANPPRVIILELQEVAGIDATALIMLQDIYEKARAEKTTLVLQGVHGQPYDAMVKKGFVALFGAENFVDDESAATARALEIINA